MYDDLRALGFSDPESWLKLQHYIRARDEPALRQFMVLQVDNGNGTMFFKGDVVFCLDIHVSQQFARVRKQGQLKEYWILWQAMEKQYQEIS